MMTSRPQVLRQIVAELDTNERALLVPPKVAWPTVALGSGVAVGFVAIPCLAIAGLMPIAAAVAAQAVLAFAAFTPMHDAAHQSVARRGLLNEVIGWSMSFILLAPFSAFRLVHLTHHKHTNDAQRDPDMWSGTGHYLTWPLRWATQDLYYYAYYFARRRERPRGEVFATALGLFGALALAGALISQGYGREVALYWIIPTRIAILLLALAFDFVPHHPHTVLDAENPMQASSIIERKWLTPLMLGQNYHLIHHLFPGVPFYDYGRAWWALRAKLVARGAWIRD